MTGEGTVGPKIDERMALRIGWSIAAIGFLVQMAPNGRYGYFRDELYYLAASDHLAFGYVDFAPLIAWLAHASRAVSGDSLHAIRLLPALAFAGEIGLTGLLAIELGGRKWAVIVGCTCVLVAPVILGNGTWLSLNPIADIVWFPGLWFLFFHRDGKRYRVLGFTYLFFLTVMTALKGKDYYLAPIYPMLFAAGGVFWETIAAQYKAMRWARVAVPSLVLALGMVSAPIVLPILPPEKIVPYMSAIGVQVGRSESNMSSMIPQHFADEFGWEEMVRRVAEEYNALPPEQRAKTAILGGNYGGAVSPSLLRT